MTKAPSSLQELRRRIYRKAKSESVGWRRWSNEYLYDVLGLYWDSLVSKIAFSPTYDDF